MQKNNNRESKIHVIQRITTKWYTPYLHRAIAVFGALIVCAIVIVLLTGYNPLQVYSKMFSGAFGSTRKIWNTAHEVALLLIVSLAVTPAFKMKFWNIGAEGQSLVGGLAAAACMIYFGKSLPNVVLIPLTFVASVLAGVIWGVIPALFKAKFNTNETLFTLMMNYVAIQLVKFCIVYWENPKDSNNVGMINFSSMKGWLPSLFNQKYLINIIVVLIITVIMYAYLKYSKHGYEISVVGGSENTAKYIGINVPKVIIRTMAFSGAICGVAGFLLVSGADHTIATTTVGGLGFTAIMVSWLAKFNPFYMILTSLLIVFLGRGSSEIATAFQLNESISDILTGIILFFIIGCEFFVRYKVVFPSKHSKEVK